MVPSASEVSAAGRLRWGRIRHRHPPTDPFAVPAGCPATWQTCRGADAVAEPEGRGVWSGAVDRCPISGKVSESPRRRSVEFDSAETPALGRLHTDRDAGKADTCAKYLVLHPLHGFPAGAVEVIASGRISECRLCNYIVLFLLYEWFVLNGLTAPVAPYYEENG